MIGRLMCLFGYHDWDEWRAIGKYLTIQRECNREYCDTTETDAL